MIILVKFKSAYQKQKIQLYLAVDVPENSL
jgi:hypothetical protein